MVEEKEGRMEGQTEVVVEVPRERTKLVALAEVVAVPKESNGCAQAHFGRLELLETPKGHHSVGWAAEQEQMGEAVE
jgi:hypothetical protein